MAFVFNAFQHVIHYHSNFCSKLYKFCFDNGTYKKHVNKSSNWILEKFSDAKYLDPYIRQ